MPGHTPKEKLKNAARKSKVRFKSAKSTAKKKISSTVSKKQNRAKSAASKARVKISSAAETRGDSFASTQDNSRAVKAASAAADTVPLGESIDVEQQKVLNVPDIQSVFDESIGFGVALPGESGVAAVERIKKSRKSKVKKRK